jgi:putative resolvase
VNGSRSKARRLLADPGVQTVMVGHRERLDDLVRDVTQVLTSFRARLYGRRSARNRAEKALRCAARDASPVSPQAVP